jgi:hypothetical protein
MRPQIPLLFIIAGPYVAGTSLGDENAPPNAIFKAVTWNGSGCAQDSNTTWTLDGAGLLDFITPALKATVGGESKMPDMRKFCQVNLDVISPEGWQYGIEKLGIVGKVTLVEGLGGSVKGSAYFSGETGDVSEPKLTPS